MKKHGVRAVVPGLALLVILALIFGHQRAKAQGFGGTPWTCSLDDIGATLTQCQQRTGDGTTALKVTDITIQSTTATAGQFILRYGTGTNCATSPTSIFPSAATVVRFGYPGNAAVPTVITFRQPLKLPADKALCILCVATNTCTVQIAGEVVPQ